MAKVLTRLDRHAPSQPVRNDQLLVGRKVLVVDDSASQRKKLKEMYESFGMVCVGEAKDGIDCLCFLEKFMIDMVSLDVLMPTMHGIETLKHLRKSYPEIVVVLVSVIDKLDALPEFQNTNVNPDAIMQKGDSRDIFQHVLREVFNAVEVKNNEDLSSVA